MATRRSKRDITIAELLLSDKPKVLGLTKADKDPKMVLEVDVTYHEGGYNYFSGSRNGRGYYLGVTPLETAYDPTTGIGSKAFTIGAGPRGRRILLEAATRFNARKLTALAAAAKLSGSYMELVNRVLIDNGLTLAPTAPLAVAS